MRLIREFCSQYFTGGHPWLFGLLNCFVHLIMYGYYFGSVYRPQLKTNITIKRSITQLQIVSETFKLIESL